MTYDAREKSTYGGQPVECFRFAHGATLWTHTSADVDVVLPDGTYTPETLKRGRLEFSQEDGSQTLEVSLPYTHAIVSLFQAFTPSSPVSLTVYRAHRGDAEVKVLFVGTVGGVRLEGAVAVLTCIPEEQSLKRIIPLHVIQTPCNLFLYSNECGVDRSLHRVSVTVTNVTGSTVVSNTFAAQPNGWWTTGYLQDAAGNVRWIVDHVGNTVTLMYPFETLAVGATVDAYPGCDHSEAACGPSKFNNLERHLGFARIPTRNPYTGRID